MDSNPISRKNARNESMFGFVLLLTLWATHVSAATLAPLSYDMLNGNGQASGGAFNYWDKFYTGTGNTTQDNAPLSGGLGDLTDGFTTNENWFNVENTDGTGPYVGWLFLNPTITFHFAAVATYTQINVHVDDSVDTGVYAPASITVSDGNATTFPVTDPGNGAAPFWVNLNVSPLGLSGNTLFITLNRNRNWVFADEVQFLGTSTPTTVSEPSSTSATVPEPSSVTLFVLGMLGITFGPLLSKKSHRFNAIDAATFGMLGGRDQDGETIIKYLAAHFGK
jgi:hypothetical protein